MVFDEKKVLWMPLGELEHFTISVCDVDVEKKLVEFMVRFEPNQQIILHRHLAHTNTFVVQGEHRFYEPDGRLKEVRAVGSYTVSPYRSFDPSSDHREGAGADVCVVLYVLRGDTDALFELLNDDGSVAQALGVQDVAGLFEEQKKLAAQGAPLAAAS